MDVRVMMMSIVASLFDEEVSLAWKPKFESTTDYLVDTHCNALRIVQCTILPIIRTALRNIFFLSIDGFDFVWNGIRAEEVLSFLWHRIYIHLSSHNPAETLRFRFIFIQSASWTPNTRKDETYSWIRCRRLNGTYWSTRITLLQLERVSSLVK